MKIPSALSSLFSEEHFVNYPKIVIPQEFFDDRGSIRNIADGALGDVAVITSVSTSIRANHYHDKDWHLSYVVSGSMRYLWKEELDSEIENSLIVKGGEMVYTKPGSPHKMIFLEETTFIAVSALSRNQENYESDTKRLPENFFKV